MISQEMENKENLSILQIGALGLPIRRDLKYAGTERVISYLDDEFVERGHNSIVAAPGDSDIAGKLYSTIPESLWSVNSNAGGRKILAGDEAYILHYNKVIDFLKENKIDIAHDHPGNGFVHSDEYFDRGKEIKGTPILTTQHGKYLKEYKEKYKRWGKLISDGYPIYFNAISHSQKKEFEEKTGVEIREVVYHGIPLKLFSFNNNPRDYLFSLGRICEDKGQHIAIDVAKRTKRPLILAGEVHSINKDYFEDEVKPSLDFSILDIPADKREDYKNDLISRLDSGEELVKEGQVHFFGGLDDKQKAVLYKNSSAFLMPIRWPEPFGLVMIESMATGTPVIAFDYGSVPEVIKNKESGFLINKEKDSKGNLKLENMVQEMSHAVENIGLINRYACRKRVEDNFTIERETQQYINLYKELISSS